MDGFASVENLAEIFRSRLADSSFRGVDGISAKGFAKVSEGEFSLISERIKSGSYRFSRYKEKLVLKGSESLPRQISIPTIRDAIALRAACNYLTHNFPDSVPKPPHDYIKRISAEVSQVSEDGAFVRLDIRNFYPTIVHSILLAKLESSGADPTAISLVRSAIETVTGLAEPGKKNTIGVPQGLSISNILASIYLKEFDDRWSSRLKYFRYVDDILILTDMTDADRILKAVSVDLLSSLSLSAHEFSKGGSGKTTIRAIREGVDYLGFTLSTKPLRVREKSYRKVFDAIVKICTRHKYDRSDARFLWKLNLRITGCIFQGRTVGWVFYFRQMNDMTQLHRLDVFVQQMLGKYGRPDLRGQVLSFVKAYREIRFNKEDTTYIPNFDRYTLADMVRTIVLLTKESEAAVGAKSKADIEKQFFSIIKKQTLQLESETVDFATS